MTAIWDFLVWVLVVFPWLTGGVWIHRPGLKIELSELGIPVAIVTLLALLLQRAGKLEWRKASSVRAATRAWSFWRKSLSARPLLTLTLAAAAVGTVFVTAAIRRHLSFGSSSYDLGIFVNGIWNLATTGEYYSAPRGGVPLLSDHQMFIVWPISAIFRMFPSAETLLVLQGFALAAGALPLWRLGAQYLGKGHWGTAALPLLYWAYLPLRNANAYDFHPEALSLPLFLAAIAGMQERTTRARVAGVLCLVLGALCKETSAATACGIGLAWLAGASPEGSRGFTRRAGWAVAAFGFAVFAVDLTVVPKLSGSAHLHLGAQLEQYGGTVAGFLASPFTRPAVFFGNLLGPRRLSFLLWVLAPLGFLPLFRWRPLLASLPMLLLFFLTGGTHKISLGYHYGAEVAVGFFWAAAAALAGPEKNLPPRTSRMFWFRAWARAAQPWPLLVLALLFFGRPEFQRIRWFSPTEHHRWLREEALPCLSETASLAATDALVPHLSTRAWVHALPRLTDGGGAPVACVAIDSSLSNWGLQIPIDEFRATLDRESYVRAYGCGSFEVFARAPAGGECLRCQPPCP